MNGYITQYEAARYLGISEASILNWIRHGYLSKFENKFKSSEIEELKKKIDSGEINRLNNRANKSKSQNKFIPNEYITSFKSLERIELLADFINKNHIKSSQAIFLLALNLFKQNGDIYAKNFEDLFLFSKKQYRRKNVYSFLSTWKEEIALNKINYENKEVKFLLNFELPLERDILGIIYQSIINEGKKSNLGSYYTPRELVLNLLEGKLTQKSKVLDPCCGTGQFLLVFSETITEPQNIFGFDIDKNAVQIAKCNLFLTYKEYDFSPNIFHLNSLLLNNEYPLFLEYGKKFSNFDLIATNPPWGAKYDNNTLKTIKNHFSEIDSKESFSFFIVQSFRLLADYGEMCFVVPESLTNVKTHRDIRNFILKNCAINNISILGKYFKNVMSSVITLSLKKEYVTDFKIQVVHNTEKYQINQKRFCHNKFKLFDIYINEIDSKIFAKIENRDYKTLEGSSEWALGIVTGDNKKYLTTNKSDNVEPVFKGSDIKPFVLKKPENFIQLNPSHFQQIAPIRKYRSREKLVYKFISKNLVFAYDSNGSLTLNSANILIPKISNYPIKLVLGFLNSRVFNFYFRKKFNSIKILRSNIEELPFPILLGEEQKKMIKLVDAIMELKLSLEELNEFVFKYYDISQEERGYINYYLES